MKKIALLLAGLFASVAARAQSIALYSNDRGALLVDGYLAGYGIYNGVSSRSSGTNKLDFTGYGKIRFKGGQQIDEYNNFGAYVELLTDPYNDGTDHLFRETYVYAEGNYGRFEIGRARGIGRKIHIVAPDVGLLDIDGSYYLDYISPPAGFVYISSTAINTDRESNKINYISPSFYGWQVAGSYIPGAYDLNGDNTLGYDKFRKAWAASVKYGSDRDLSFDVGSARFMDTNMPVSETAVRDEFSAGAKYYYRGLQVSASYRRILEDGVRGPVSQEGYAVNYGLAYEFGPMKLSLSNHSSRTDGDVAVPGFERLRLTVLSGRYALSEYVDFSASAGRIAYGFEDGSSLAGLLLVSGFMVDF
jgi:predicted porin